MVRAIQAAIEDELGFVIAAERFVALLLRDYMALEMGYKTGSQECVRLRWCFLRLGGPLLLLFLLQVVERGENIHRSGMAIDNTFSVAEGGE
jgi:hypothetical protein